MRKRLITQCLTLLGLWLLPLPIPLLLPHAVAQVRQPPAALQTEDQPPVVLEYQNDFQTDCRAEFQSTGQVDWQAGQLTLQPGSTISKEVNGNWQAEWQFDLDCEAVPADTTAEFVFQVTMDDDTTPWQLVWEVSQNGNDNSIGTLTLFATMIHEEQQQLVRVKQNVLATFAGTWQVHYCGGLVQVQQNGKQVFVGYVANAIRGIQNSQWQSKQARLTLTRWQHRSYTPLVLTEAQQQQVQQADQFNQKAIRLRQAGQLADAFPLAKQSLQIQREVFGENHPQMAVSYYTLGAQYQALARYDEAEPLFQRALAICEQTLGKEHPAIADSLNHLAGLYKLQGKYTEAKPLLERALAICEKTLGKEHLTTATSLSNLASLYKVQGKYAEAEPLFQRALAIQEQTLGKEHPHIAQLLNALAALYYYQGKYTQAEPLYQKALSIFEQTLGKEHPITATSLNNLAALYHVQGKYTEAEPLFQQALAIREQILGKVNPFTAESLNNLAGLYHDQGKYSAAEPLYQRALAIREQLLGNEHPSTAESLNNLAGLYDSQGKYREAETLYQRALAIREQVLGNEHPHTAINLSNLAQLYYYHGKYTAAEPLFQRALAIHEQTLGNDHPTTAELLNKLAMLYKSQRKYTEAEPLFRRVLAIYEQRLGKEHPHTAISLGNLAQLYYNQEKYSEAEPLMQRALEIDEQTLGKEHPTTATALNNLAELYRVQGKYSEAEPLLQQAIQIQELNRSQLNDDRLARSQNERQFTSHRTLTLLYLNTQRPLQAWQFWEQSLGRGFLDELTARQLSALQPEQKQQLQSVQALCQSYAKLLKETADKAGISQTQREAWQQQLYHHQAELAQLQHDLGSQSERTILAGKAYQLTEIQKQLLPHQALVGWLDRENSHFGYVVRSTGEPFWIELPGKGEAGQLSPVEVQLASQVVHQLSERNLSYLFTHWQQLNAFLKQLQQQRLAPLQPALAAHNGLPTATHLIILPSEGMAGVPIETLVDASQLVSYASSGTVFAWLRQQRQARLQRAAREGNELATGLLALGDPVFNPATISTSASTTTDGKPGPKWGLVLASVKRNGPGAQAGLKTNDVLLSYNGIDVYQFDELSQALQLAQQQGLQEVPVKLWRPDGEVLLAVPAGTLGISLDPKPIQLRPTQDLAKRTNGMRWYASMEQLPTLLGTRCEVEQLQQLAQQADVPATVLLGSDASEQKLYEMAQAGELKKYKYLHFATHGEANSEFHLQSKLFLARDQLPDPLEQIKAGQPVFRGELTAATILQSWHLNAELAVLSACQTGLGQFKQTEGYIGLSQPFLLAGTQSVLVSLWSVDDTATQLLMIRFYENLWGLRKGLTQPMNKIDALHEAKQWLRALTQAEVVSEFRKRGLKWPTAIETTAATAQPFAHPHYWAAFILVGDWQ